MRVTQVTGWIYDNVWLARYLAKIIAWLDRGCNVVLLDGDPAETVSSHAAKAAAAGRRWGCVLCGLLDKIDRGHCQRFVDPKVGEPIA